eukprot:4896805-Prymnesium_polylepis.1
MISRCTPAAGHVDRRLAKPGVLARAAPPAAHTNPSIWRRGPSRPRAVVQAAVRPVREATSCRSGDAITEQHSACAAALQREMAPTASTARQTSLSL